MRIPKIYLDTSVISHLYQPDAPEKMVDTLRLWDEIKTGLYDVYISNIVLNEIADCKEAKRNRLERYLAGIDFKLITITEEIEALAGQIIKQGILTPKSYDDCLHISSAVIHDCDIIVSWNFKHIVNVKTINGIRAINILNGYKPIDIYTPIILTEGGNDDE